MWLILEECHELLDALPVLVADPDHDGDIIKTESLEDDIADTARYGLKSELSPAGKPIEEQRQDMLAGVRDQVIGKQEGPLTVEAAVDLYNKQAFADRKFQEEMKKKQKPLKRPMKSWR